MLDTPGRCLLAVALYHHARECNPRRSSGQNPNWTPLAAMTPGVIVGDRFRHALATLYINHSIVPALANIEARCWASLPGSSNTNPAACRSADLHNIPESTRAA